MSFQIAALFSQLKEDSWRRKAGFSADIERVQAELFSSQLTRDSAVRLFNEWLQKNQPCVFGRLAAKFGFIEYCVLTEADLQLSDEAIEEKIQTDRLRWWKAAYNGQKSNFIIVVISPTIAYAEPNTAVASLAQQLCSRNLQLEAQFDFVHHDNIFLEKPGPRRVTWRWLAGVNYFAAHADNRWWHDHRIPGGLGFSINSVGHLVRSEKISDAMRKLDLQLGINEEEWNDSKVDSLEKALILAMQTISNAGATPSGPATQLLSLPKDVRSNDLPECPTKLPTALEDKNYCEYVGYYHTDFTLPSEYFVPDVMRQQNVEPFILDFTYLFHHHPNNPDHSTMARGVRIRADGERKDSITNEEELTKGLKATPDVVAIEDYPLLRKALEK